MHYHGRAREVGSDLPFYQTEALQWLQKDRMAVVAPNFFYTNAKAAEGIESLYKAGAVAVEAVVFKRSPTGQDDTVVIDESCSELEVTLPRVVSDALVSAIKSIHPDNFEDDPVPGEDRYSFLKESGGSAVTLWWD